MSRLFSANFQLESLYITYQKIGKDSELPKIIITIDVIIDKFCFILLKKFSKVWKQILFSENLLGVTYVKIPKGSK